MTSRIAGGGWGRAIADRPLTPFPADAEIASHRRLWTINRHSGQLHAQNVAKQPEAD